jgi:hypothetical protein
MQTVPMKPAVRDFLLCSQVLVTPTLRPADLTHEECLAIAQFIQKLSRSDNPWAKALPLRYNV